MDLRLQGAKDEFRAMLERGAVAEIMAASDIIFPANAQPKDYWQAEIMMHVARTSAASVSFNARAYSHRWLTERDLPSQLPDELKPKAERLYPVVVEAVGISVNSKNKYFEPVAVEARTAMENVVQDCYANGDRDPKLIKSLMFEAKDKTFRQLLGRIFP